MAEGSDTGRRGILGVGNLLVDKTHRIPAYPAESMLAVIDDSAMSPGGGVFNVLCDLARVDPALPLAAAGLVGDDPDGRLIRRAFEGHGIDGTQIGVIPDRPTSFTQVMISQSRATRTFFHAHGANSRFDLDRVRTLGGGARIAHLAYLLLLDGLDRSDPDFGSAGAHALAILKDKGFETSLDLVSDPDAGRYHRFVLPALPFTDYLIINDVEAAKMTGTPLVTEGAATDWDGALGQAEQLLAKGVNRLVVIHFPQGAVAAGRDGQRCRQTAYPVSRVVSALGAGDAFCAGVLYGLHQGEALDRCLKLGAALAHFTLFADSATDGAVPLTRLAALIGA
jgi:sugar/nucleoside kinase (ribokinase family)